MIKSPVRARHSSTIFPFFRTCPVSGVRNSYMAYGDPSGGFLFQFLAPLTAVLWGGWLILAGRIRKRFGRLIRRPPDRARDQVAETIQDNAEID